jgi:hypothetical protein
MNIIWGKVPQHKVNLYFVLCLHHYSTQTLSMNVILSKEAFEDFDSACVGIQKICINVLVTFIWLEVPYHKVCCYYLVCLYHTPTLSMFVKSSKDIF